MRLNKFDTEGLAISLQKFEFAKPTIEYLGLKIYPHGVTPLISKTEALQKLDPPKTLKQLRSFMSSIHYLTKLIPNLAELSEPLQPLLKTENTTTSNKLKREEKHTTTFSNIKKQISKIIENKHFDVDKETRVKCDASKLGLGATLEQKTNNIWQFIAFASRLLNPVEQKHSKNELELLAVVWPFEQFKHSLEGSEFTFQTDHQALLTALKENRVNKTYQSRLTRWVDRLLPFSFNMKHIPGRQMAFADYFSRNPNGTATPPSGEDTHFIINQINDLRFTLIIIKLRNNNSHANKKPNNYDVTKQAQLKQSNPRAFCHFRLRNQSLIRNTQKFQTGKSHSIQLHSNSINSLNKSLSIYTKNFTSQHITHQTVNVFTRNRPLVETSRRPIVRRFKGPNKTKTVKTPTMENQSTRPH